MALLKAGVGLLAALVGVALGANPAGAQTISLNQNAQVEVGAAIDLDLVLNSAPLGLQDYRITVTLDKGTVADIEGVEFPETFRERGAFTLLSERNQVTISSEDALEAVGPHASHITLAVLRLRGTWLGTTSLQIVVERVRDDALVPFQVAVRGGVLRSVGNLTAQPTTVAGTDAALAGGITQVPVILTRATRGLKSFQLGLQFEPQDLVDVLAVRFVAFNGNPKVMLSPDGSAVRIEADDLDNRVGLDASGVVLAYLLLRGVIPGRTTLQVKFSSYIDDDGNTINALKTEGLVTVGAVLDLPPPQFYNLTPAQDARLAVRQPLLSLRMVDAGSGINPDSIRVLLTGPSGQAWEFNRDSPGASWDGERFQLNLSAAGVELASGLVRVKVLAADNTDHLGTTSWSFHVTEDALPPPAGTSLAAALDVNHNHQLDDDEIMTAVQLWISGRVVPGAGEQIDDRKILELIQLWISGGPVENKKG